LSWKSKGRSRYVQDDKLGWPEWRKSDLHDQADHTPQRIDRAIAAITKIGKELGVI